MFTQFDKAIVALVSPLILTALLSFGITGDMTVSDAVKVGILALFTAVSVYLTKNKVK